MRRVCVFCGSAVGARPEYAEAAEALGRAIAARGLGLVFGGGAVGLMGIVSRAVLAAGGAVTGIIPHGLVVREAGNRDLTDLRIVASMHERKAMMAEMSDGFLVLPGGFGTLDEMFEMLTWRQLGLGKKPCAFLDVDDFWQPLMAMLDRMVAARFLHPEQRQDMWHGGDIDALLAWMRSYVPAQADKWLDEKRRSQLALTTEDV